jgi:ATPase subunit of ABC transporter with duplicated ATPase domains
MYKRSKNNKNNKIASNTDYKNFKIEPVDISFGKLVILENTKLVIQFGERYGLVGKNGIGKTSLLNAIAYRQLPIPEKLDIIHVKQEEAETTSTVIETLMSANINVYKMNKRLQELELIISNNDFSDDDILEEYENISKQIGFDYEKSKAYAQKILYGLGFGLEDQNREVREFSGGWRMRISLAKALFMTPTMLILDEPTNHLDLHANIWLSEYLKTYPKTVLLVSHDKYFVDEVCTAIIHINGKKLSYYTGNYDQFQKQLKQNMEKNKKDWKAMEKKILLMKKTHKTSSEIDAFIKKTNIIKPEKEYIVKINFMQPTLIGHDYLILEEVSFSYNNDHNVIENLNMTISAGQHIAIVGKNGVGKTTILKLLIDELKPASGIIKRSPIVKIGYYNQHFEESMPFNIDGVQYLMELNKEIDITTAHKYLSLFGLEPIYHSTKIGALSGGQKARVKFASFGVTKPHLLVLDEPSNHLDIDAIESLVSALNNFEGAIVLVSHNFDIVTSLNCELWFVENACISKYPSNYDDYVQKIYEECLPEES